MFPFHSIRNDKLSTTITHISVFNHVLCFPNLQSTNPHPSLNTDTNPCKQHVQGYVENHDFLSVCVCVFVCISSISIYLSYYLSTEQLSKSCKQFRYPEWVFFFTFTFNFLCSLVLFCLFLNCCCPYLTSISPTTKIKTKNKIQTRKRT